MVAPQTIQRNAERAQVKAAPKRGDPKARPRALAELVAVLAVLNVCRENLEPEELTLREKDLGLIAQFRH
jgi:hypothetical protein